MATTVADELTDRVNDNVITATPEDTLYASQNYSTGDYILIQGKLYRAIDNISASDLFSVSNVVACTVGEELTSLYDQMKKVNLVSTGHVSAATGITVARLVCNKINKLVVLSFRITGTIVPSTRLINFDSTLTVQNPNYDGIAITDAGAVLQLIVDSNGVRTSSSSLNNATSATGNITFMIE